MAVDIPATIHEQVEIAEGLEISYRTLHPPFYINNKQDETKIEIPYSSITNKYRTYLMGCLVQFQLSEPEKELYRFQPKTLSYDLYGTTELWADLLKLNNAVSVVDFKPNFVTAYDPNRFKEFLNEVMIMDQDCIY